MCQHKAHPNPKSKAPTSSLLLAPLSSARPGPEPGDNPAPADGPIDGISSARPDRPPICVFKSFLTTRITGKLQLSTSTASL